MARPLAAFQASAPRCYRRSLSSHPPDPPSGRSHSCPENRYDAYERLIFDRPADGVLRVTMHNPDNPMNSVDAKMHEELVAVWPDIDADRDVGAVILRGPAGPIRRAATSA